MGDTALRVGLILLCIVLNIIFWGGLVFVCGLIASAMRKKKEELRAASVPCQSSERIVFMKRVAKDFWVLLVVLVIAGGWFCYRGWFDKPELPITVSYRDSAWGQGYVVAFHNESSKYLQVILTAKNETLGQEKSGSLDIGPGETKEIGWLEGWKFSSGETIEVEHASYRKYKWTIP